MEMLFAAVHESAPVQVFGRRHGGAIHALMRPAIKKRQGTKSRWDMRGGAASAMGILPRRLV
jgi:hypothetical protein